MRWERDSHADQTAGRSVKVFQCQYSLAGDDCQRTGGHRQGLSFAKALAASLGSIKQQQAGSVAVGMTAGGREIDHRQAAVGTMLEHEVKVGGLSIAGGVPAAVEGVLLVGEKMTFSMFSVVQLELAFQHHDDPLDIWQQGKIRVFTLDGSTADTEQKVPLSIVGSGWVDIQLCGFTAGPV